MRATYRTCVCTGARDLPECFTPPEREWHKKREAQKKRVTRRAPVPQQRPGTQSVAVSRRPHGRTRRSASCDLALRSRTDRACYMGCGGSTSRVTPGNPATDSEPLTQAHGLTAGSSAIHEEPPAEPAQYEQHEQQEEQQQGIVQARARANDPRWDVKAFETLVEHDTPFVSAGYLRQLRGKALVNAELSHHRVPSSELHRKLPGGVGI
eukprot:3350041-Prymnesium_polylepis.1